MGPDDSVSMQQTALALCRKADRIQLLRTLQFGVLGGMLGAALGIAIKMILPAVVLGVGVGAIIGWKDAALQAYQLRMTASNLLDRSETEAACKKLPHKIRHLRSS